MAILDFLNGIKYKKELEQLKQYVNPEIEELIDLDNKRIALQDLLEKIKIEKNATVKKLNNDINNKSKQANNLELKKEKLQIEINEKKKQVFTLDENILMQEFGLYEPIFDFAKASIYKEKLSEIRKQQKELIKQKNAFFTNPNWQVNGSIAKGRKMSSDIAKLLLRTFNDECDVLISRVKFNNLDSFEKRMNKSFEQINKLGKVMNVSLNQEYQYLKEQELHLAYEYAQKVEAEKEEAREERQRLREEEKLRQEVKKETEKINKEEKHFKQALTKIKNEMNKASENDKSDLIKKIAELELELDLINKKKSDMDYRINNTRAGYVYIISNIGSFGENVYKIGMTRRLEPLDRVNELGDASVPFRYDVHALIFSNDAPKLENELHKAFRNEAVNMVNNRREFFKTELSAIEEVVQNNHDKTVKFEETPQAEEYRNSIKMRTKSH